MYLFSCKNSQHHKTCIKITEVHVLIHVIIGHLTFSLKKYNLKQNIKVNKQTERNRNGINNK